MPFNCLQFDVLWRDTLISTVKVNGLSVKLTNYDSRILLRPFGVNTQVDVNDVYNFFLCRVVPPTRDGIEDILKAMGLAEYNPVAIARVTHGILTDDYTWIRFKEDGNITWKDVKYLKEG